MSLNVRNSDLRTKNYGDISTLDEKFAKSPPPSLGVEVELFMTNQRGRPIPVFDAVYQKLSDEVKATVDGEFLQCQIELKSQPRHRIDDIRSDLGSTIDGIENVLKNLSGRLTWESELPNWKFDQRMIRDCDRSWINVDRFGERVSNLGMCGMHIHVAVPRHRAMEIADTLQSYVPLLLALSTGSRVGRSRRAHMWGHELSTTGFPTHYGTWPDYMSRLQRLQEAKLIESQKDLYSFIRPTRYGTLELRCFDVPNDLQHLMALAALTQCLAVYAQDFPHVRVPRELLHWNMVQAVNFGATAELCDHNGERKPATEIVRELVRRFGPIAQDLGCFDELKSLATPLPFFAKPTPSQSRRSWQTTTVASFLLAVLQLWS